MDYPYYDVYLMVRFRNEHIRHDAARRHMAATALRNQGKHGWWWVNDLKTVWNSIIKWFKTMDDDSDSQKSSTTDRFSQRNRQYA